MRLSDFLATRGISQTEFAAMIDTTQAAVSRYVKGSRMPRRAHLERIRKATDGEVSPDDFMAPEAAQ